MLPLVLCILDKEHTFLVMVFCPSLSNPSPASLIPPLLSSLFSFLFLSLLSIMLVEPQLEYQLIPRVSWMYL